MKLRLFQCALVSGCLCAAALALALLFDRVTTSVLETVLSPWLAICRGLTPEAWQTTGNLLLGTIWVLSGVALSSILVGSGCVFLWVALKRRARATL